MRAANEAVRPGLGWRIATVLGVIFGLYILAQDLDWLANLTGLSARGDIGVVITAKGTEMGSGRARVTAVVPGSSAAAAGIAQGDILTFEPHWREMSAPGIGERVEVTVSRDGARYDSQTAKDTQTCQVPVVHARNRWPSKRYRPRRVSARSR